MTDKRSSPVKAIIGADKVVGLMTEDGLNVPGFDGTGYVTDEELEERLEPASLSDLKAGTNEKKPIVPLCQHQSIFYALAKAAGANLASSTEETAPDGTNTGVYPEAAKTAIKNMLGISEGGGSTKLYMHRITFQGGGSTYNKWVFQLITNSATPFTFASLYAFWGTGAMPVFCSDTNLKVGLVSYWTGGEGVYGVYWPMATNTDHTAQPINFSTLDSDTVIEL